MNRAAATATAPAVTVHLVDDEPAVTKGLHWLLASVGIAAERWHQPDAFLAAVAAGAGPACAVLDLRMPGIGGLELVERLALARPDVPVIFLSAHGDVASAVRAMKLGAVDFLQKPFDPQSFLECVARATRLARERHAASARRRSRGELLERLSLREREIFPHMLEGASSKTIARLFDLSPRTVDVHRANILRKLEVATVRELYARFRETEPEARGG